MAIRDKIKAKFSKNKPGSTDLSPSSTTPPNYFTGRKDIEYYKPHEIPKSKYRGRIDKDHQDKLEAYSFADAFQTVRRKTSQALSGTFSPGGTKALSAAPSAAHSRRPSWVSRAGSSVSSVGHASTDNDVRRKSVSAMHHAGDDITENSEDDTDVANTGLSRSVTVHQQDHVPTIQLDRTATITERSSIPSSQGSTPVNDTPFTMEELERAMTKATLHANGAAALNTASVAA